MSTFTCSLNEVFCSQNENTMWVINNKAIANDLQWLRYKTFPPGMGSGGALLSFFVQLGNVVPVDHVPDG
jgi:hypothetical protein